MKKTLFLSIMILLLTSCNTVKSVHGDTNEYGNLVQVHKQKNNILFWGLLNTGNAIEVDRYVKNNINYVIKTQNTFVDGLLNIVTIGIYCPSTTKIYIPANPSERAYIEKD